MHRTTRDRSTARSARGARVPLLLGVILGAVLVLQPRPAAAQEIRLSGNQGVPGIEELGNPQGVGFGARFFLARGVGVGVDRDRYRSNRVVDRLVCPDSGEGCRVEPVDFEGEMDFTTFLLLLELGRSEDWTFRLGIGRSAGRITGGGFGRESGGWLEAAPADDGSGVLSWKRGADGSVIILEFLRSIPIPGPFPLDVQAAYRHNRVDMQGCAQGEFSPFCGQLGLNEFQAGLVLGFRRRPLP
jgi:hypothetical protein